MASSFHALFLHPRRKQHAPLLAEQVDHAPQGVGCQLHLSAQTGGAEDVGGLFVHRAVITKR